MLDVLIRNFSAADLELLDKHAAASGCPGPSSCAVSFILHLDKDFDLVAELTDQQQERLRV